MRIGTFQAPAPDGAAGPGPLQGLREIASWRWFRRARWAFLCGVLWVGLEIILAHFLSGFPWNTLGVSQHRILPLIQLASITGVYGVSFVVVWTSASLLVTAAGILCRPARRSPWVGDILLPSLAVLVLFSFGLRKLSSRPADSPKLNVTLVQPSIPQTLIWNPGKDTERFHDLMRLSEAALSNKTDLLIWPEAAIPKLLRYDEETFRAVTGLARKHHVWMIVGSDDAEPSAKSNRPEDADYFNSSFLIDPEGRLVSTYKKRNLVIFGEYVPLTRWLPFLKWFTPVQGGFKAGDKPVPFELTWPSQPAGGTADEAAPARRVKTSVLICFEDTFAELGREGAGADTDFLVNITNDGWFGEGAAQRQHAATALFRSVENGLPLVRCTNTGLTCWYDSNGVLREFLTAKDGTIYGEGFMTAAIPLLAPGEERSPTFYHRHGDWFGWGCAGLSALLLAGSGIRSRRAG
jgi:apolipoprotein N-acyltransferase